MMTKTFELEGVIPEAAEEDDDKSVITGKGIARFIVGSSVKFIVTSTIVSLVPTETRIQKAKLLVGGYALSGVLAERAKDYISDDIDEKFEYCRDVIQYVKKLTKEQADEADVSNP